MPAEGFFQKEKTIGALSSATAATAIVIVPVVSVPTAAAAITAATTVATTITASATTAFGASGSAVLRGRTHLRRRARVVHPRGALRAHGRLIRWLLRAGNLKRAVRRFLARRHRLLKLLALLLLKIPLLLLLLLFLQQLSLLPLRLLHIRASRRRWIEFPRRILAHILVAIGLAAGCHRRSHDARVAAAFGLVRRSWLKFPRVLIPNRGLPVGLIRAAHNERTVSLGVRLINAILTIIADGILRPVHILVADDGAAI
jgi:hypothetical protein